MFNSKQYEIIKEALGLVSSLFEVDDEDNIENSPNKISYKNKDKEGKNIETISVEDELFPYEGTAKEQFNKKVIAKINDMIEGKATLNDLLQLVRKGYKG